MHPPTLRIEPISDSPPGGYFGTSGDDPSIKIRIKDDYDGAEPTASSISALNLFRFIREQEFSSIQLNLSSDLDFISQYQVYFRCL